MADQPDSERLEILAAWHREQAGIAKGCQARAKSETSAEIYRQRVAHHNDAADFLSRLKCEILDF